MVSEIQQQPDMSAPTMSSPEISLAYEFVSVRSRKPFPSSILCFRTYGALKVLSMFLFIWALVSFGETLYLVGFHGDQFFQNATIQVENRGILKRAYYWTKGILWQDTPKEQQCQKCVAECH